MKSLSSFRRCVVLVATLFVVTLTTAAEWAPKLLGWDGLERNMTPHQAAMVLSPAAGPPLVVTRSKGGRFETWTYDRGGCLVFVAGALDYWTAPRAPATGSPKAPH